MTVIGFRDALGIHESAMNLRARRAEVLANNLVNADTPGFKARDIDFQTLLQQAQGATGTVALRRTSDRHLGGLALAGDSELLYRVPNQPSLDGNTVEEHAEMARYIDNAQAFEASLHFLSSKFRGLQSAIRGEAQ
jgi:flagellar basal-body rod protein FlgB